MLVQMVDHAAGGADHHVHAAAQGAQLGAVALAAVDRQHMKAGNMRGIALERFGHLDRQFAVGASTSACGVFCCRSMRDSTGSANAAVLPVPVWPGPAHRGSATA